MLAEFAINAGAWTTYWKEIEENKYPDDLAEYTKRFEAQAIDIAKRAVVATRDMKEQVF